MNIAPMSAHKWKFEFNDSQLIISAEDSSQQLRLNARAAFSLLDYLYQYREDLHKAAVQEENAQVEQQKTPIRPADEI